MSPPNHSFHFLILNCTIISSLNMVYTYLVANKNDIMMDEISYLDGYVFKCLIFLVCMNFLLQERSFLVCLSQRMV